MKSFDAEFPLVANVDGKGKNITMPEGIRYVCHFSYKAYYMFMEEARNGRMGAMMRLQGSRSAGMRAGATAAYFCVCVFGS